MKRLAGQGAPRDGVKGRLALISALVPVAWLMVQNSLTLSLENRAPVALARLVPGAPVSLEVQAAKELSRPAGSGRDRARSLLRESLVQRLFSPQPLRLLGTAEGALTFDPKALPFFLLAEKTSRRDLASQLYLISVDARARRVTPALQRVDRTLRVSTAARQRLFPLLAQQIANPVGRREFAQLAGQDTPWLANFLSYVVDTETDPAALALTVVELGGYPDTEARPAFEQSLVRSLDSKGQYEALARLLPVLKFAPGNLLRTAALDRETLNPIWDPLGWQISDDAAIAVYSAIDQAGAGSLEVTMGGGLSGRAARKLVSLAPGRYRLAIKQRVDAQGDGSQGGGIRPEWTVSCMKSDPPPTLLVLQGTVASGDFTVGRDCPMVQVALFVRAPDEATASMSVQTVSIRRTSFPADLAE